MSDHNGKLTVCSLKYFLSSIFRASKNRVKNAKAIAILKKYGAVSMAPIDKKLLEKFADNNDNEDSKKNSDNEIKK